MGSRTIMVGYKANANSADALWLGAMLARYTGAELVVAHVYHGPVAGAPAVLAEAERLLPYGMRADLRAVEGRPVHALRALAANVGADLIVVGSSTRRSLELHTAGGIVERLLRGSGLQVAVAPRGFHSERDAGLRVIGVAVDGSPESEAAVAAAAELAQTAGAALELIGVVEPLSPSTAPGAMYAPVEGACRDGLQRQLEAMADALPHELRPAVVLADGDAAGQLVERASPLSLLVMGSRCHGPVMRALVGSVSARVVRASECPVLVVPRRALAEAAATG